MRALKHVSTCKIHAWAVAQAHTRPRTHTHTDKHKHTYTLPQPGPLPFSVSLSFTLSLSHTLCLSFSLPLLFSLPFHTRTHSSLHKQVSATLTCQNYALSPTPFTDFIKVVYQCYQTDSITLAYLAYSLLLSLERETIVVLVTLSMIEMLVEAFERFKRPENRSYG